MAREFPCYRVADQGALAALRAALRAAVGVRPARVHALSRTYYDTPDRRLYRAGRVLELCERRGERSLLLRALGNGQALATQAIAAPPRFAKGRALLPEFYLHGLAMGDFELALRGLLARISHRWYGTRPYLVA